MKPPRRRRLPALLAWLVLPAVVYSAVVSPSTTSSQTLTGGAAGGTGRAATGTGGCGGSTCGGRPPSRLLGGTGAPASVSASPSESVLPSPTPPAQSAVSYTALSYVCGNGVCDASFEGYGETCGNCPADCGPCQQSSDVSTCVRNDVVALMFDGGPTNYTNSVLSVLSAANVTGNFFAVGDQIAQFTTVFDWVRASGSRRYFNGYTHTNLDTLTLQQVYREVQQSISAFATNTCERPTLFRAPFGSLDPLRRALVAKMGVRPVGPTVDTLDDQYAETQSSYMLTAFNAALQALVPAGIFTLSHDTAQANVDVLPAVISALSGQGYTFVSADECTWGPTYTQSAAWVYSQAGCTLDWSSVGSRAQPGTACPVSQWSDWSPCDAQCGDGFSTRVRYAYPPSAAQTNAACADTSFIELQSCNAGPCPVLVWNNTYTGTLQGDMVAYTEPANFTELEQSLPLSMCQFGPWRWSNTTAACSQSCGNGTALMVRDFNGPGTYTYLCGPMVKPVLCQLRPCFGSGAGVAPPPSDAAAAGAGGSSTPSWVKYAVPVLVLIALAVVVPLLLFAWRRWRARRQKGAGGEDPVLPQSAGQTTSAFSSALTVQVPSSLTLDRRTPYTLRYPTSGRTAATRPVAQEHNTNDADVHSVARTAPWDLARRHLLRSGISDLKQRTPNAVAATHRVMYTRFPTSYFERGNWAGNFIVRHVEQSTEHATQAATDQQLHAIKSVVSGKGGSHAAGSAESEDQFAGSSHDAQFLPLDPPEPDMVVVQASPSYSSSVMPVGSRGHRAYRDQALVIIDTPRQAECTATHPTAFNVLGARLPVDLPDPAANPDGGSDCVSTARARVLARHSSSDVSTSAVTAASNDSMRIRRSRVIHPKGKEVGSAVAAPRRRPSPSSSSSDSDGWDVVDPRVAECMPTRPAPPPTFPRWPVTVNSETNPWKDVDSVLTRKSKRLLAKRQQLLGRPLAVRSAATYDLI